MHKYISVEKLTFMAEIMSNSCFSRNETEWSETKKTYTFPTECCSPTSIQDIFSADGNGLDLRRFM